MLIGANVPMYWDDSKDISEEDQTILNAYHAADPSTQKAIRIMLHLEK